MSAALQPLVTKALRDARAGRLQRSLALVSGMTGGLSGLEVAYMHYRGSYSRRIMWTPILMSQVLLAAGIAGAVKPRLARTLLPAVAWITLADCGTGFIFHLRGIARKPGGYRMLINNVVMGPPPFAPVLFGMSAYIGVVASKMPAEESGETLTGREHLRKHIAVITAIAALGSGVEALYSHYKNNFRYWVQYTPLIVAPTVAAAGLHSALRPEARNSRRLLAAASVAAMVDGGIGFVMHTRGIAKRAGGGKHWLYNLIYGPPVLAPLLFAGCGFLGLIAAVVKARQ